MSLENLERDQGTPAKMYNHETYNLREADCKSMKDHPKPGRSMTILYHQEKAFGGKQFNTEEARSLEGKNGWVDSPAKFNGVNSASQDSGGSDAERDAIVDKAVGEELKKKRAKEAEKTENQEYGVGVFESTITFDAEAFRDKAMVEDFVQFHKLSKGLDLRKGLEKLVNEAEALVNEHNNLFDALGERSA